MSNKKKVLSVVVGIIALLAVAAGTVFVLSKLNGVPSEKANVGGDSQTSAGDIIKDLRVSIPSTLTSFSSQVAAKGQFKITAKSSDKAFSVAIPADEVLVFTPKDKSGVSNPAAILADSKKYFESQGLTETASTSSSASYANQASLCQVQIQTGEAGAVMYGCSASDAVQKEYAAVTALIKLYNGAHPTKTIAESSFASASRTLRQKDTVEGAILSLQPSDAASGTGKVLLFGAVSGNWEYVADLTTGENSGKANVPSDAAVAIKDKKWDGVLSGLVGL